MKNTKVKIMVAGLVGAFLLQSCCSFTIADAKAAKSTTKSAAQTTAVSGVPTAGISSVIGKALRKTSGKKVHVKKNRRDKVSATYEETFKSELKTGYVNADVLNVRDQPGKHGEVVTKLRFNEEVEYCETEFEDWVAIGDDRYVSVEYLGKKPVEYRRISATNNWRKSFESKNVFGRNTRQQRLQNIAYTDSMGFRIMNGRYCIAVGSAIGDKVGCYIDVVLENGTVIPCIMGDQKDDRDTEATNQRTSNGCVSEFIVDVNALCKNGTKAGALGDVSYAHKEWKSRVTEFRVYDFNALD